MVAKNLDTLKACFENLNIALTPVLLFVSV